MQIIFFERGLRGDRNNVYPCMLSKAATLRVLIQGHSVQWPYNLPLSHRYTGYNEKRLSTDIHVHKPMNKTKFYNVYHVILIRRWHILTVNASRVHAYLEIQTFSRTIAP